ncbi:hypothetical protein RFI_04726, partial [Reticulomyxa filosa]
KKKHQKKKKKKKKKNNSNIELQETLTSVQDHIDDATDDLQTYETKMRKLDKEMQTKEEELNDSQNKIEKLRKKERERDNKQVDRFSDDDADMFQLQGSLKKGHSHSSKHNHNTRGQSPGYPHSGSERQVAIANQLGIHTPRKESGFSYANTMSEHLGAPGLERVCFFFFCSLWQCYILKKKKKQQILERTMTDDMDFHGNQGVTARPLSPDSKAILFRDFQANPHLQMQYQSAPAQSNLNAVMMRGGNTATGYYELSDPNNGMNNGAPYIIGVTMTEPGSAYGVPHHFNGSSAGSAVNGMEGSTQIQRPLISDHGTKVIGGVVIALATLFIIHKCFV